MPTIGLPFYYDEINNLRGHKVPSVGLCYDSETFFFFWRSLYERLTSKFKWTVPDHWDKEVFEFSLYAFGFLGIFDTNKYATTPNQRYGIIPAPSTVHGIGVQMQPTKIRTANPHFYMPYDEIIYGKPWPGKRGFYVDDRAVRPDEFLKYSEEELKKVKVEVEHEYEVKKGSGEKTNILSFSELDACKSTKDKGIIEDKLHILETVMNEFLQEEGRKTA